jgi:hypothetical protein
VSPRTSVRFGGVHGLAVLGAAVTVAAVEAAVLAGVTGAADAVPAVTPAATTAATATALAPILISRPRINIFIEFMPFIRRSSRPEDVPARAEVAPRR